MQSQHSVHWKTYRELQNAEKVVFFDEVPPVVHRNAHKSHFGGSQAVKHYFADKGIVDIIIGEMLFHPDDSNDDVTKERALAIFGNVIERGEDNEQDSDLQTDCYRMSIKNDAQFLLVIDYISAGASFCMASKIVQMTKDRTGLASLGHASEGKVTSYVRIACALNLQKISEVMAVTWWAFSIAMDMSTHKSTSYLDIRSGCDLSTLARYYYFDIN